MLFWTACPQRVWAGLQERAALLLRLPAAAQARPEAAAGRTSGRGKPAAPDAIWPTLSPVLDGSLAESQTDASGPPVTTPCGS